MLYISHKIKRFNGGTLVFARNENYALKNNPEVNTSAETMLWMWWMKIRRKKYIIENKNETSKKM